METKYVFGPVNSRRLGRSLGIDLLPFKTCNLNCIYCEQGLTTKLTSQIKEWVPLKEVLNEIKNNLNTKPDYITISGSGEPTLYSRLKELIDEIKIMTTIPIALITNGTMLWDKTVRDSILKADVIMPSLDAALKKSFININRPNESLSFEKIIDGLIELRKVFSNKYWLEILFINGINNSPLEIAEFKKILVKINPDKILLNTIKRPPAEKWATPLSFEELSRIAKTFGNKAEVIISSTNEITSENTPLKEETILNLLERRPCTIDEITKGLSLQKEKTEKYILELVEAKKITKIIQDNEIYYSIFSI